MLNQFETGHVNFGQIRRTSKTRRKTCQPAGAQAVREAVRESLGATDNQHHLARLRSSCWQRVRRLGMEPVLGLPRKRKPIGNGWFIGLLRTRKPFQETNIPLSIARTHCIGELVYTRFWNIGGIQEVRGSESPGPINPRSNAKEQGAQPFL